MVHTGLDEATPAGKTMRQYFEHFGFTVLGEWYVMSQYVGREDYNTLGRMGDIRGKPTEEDLRKIRNDAEALARQIA